MNIGDYLKKNVPDIYKKLMQIGRKQQKKKKRENKAIELGDNPERLMMHDAYKRIGRRIRQIKWG